ncbi:MULTISPECIES: bifunctional Delta(1)-pyrroline-2-carboxylate/Delta(1)-piperideine-2-carboxylate reductase [unclassified Pseudomonas]|uniref:bifunctional Delta(1)-pyrroline-2-carboxylate/Delta(1)-piperideine-2- carboxylate reductase n=1 Tax=unclassified Pseudomonas TaxID=196821 RepID=UPI002AC99BA2|nr:MULTISPECIES: bifunctional Delta(1)-pyrroline-2-carboxylate/Delta(1)-piperideine-2-carboxylate reductase [unclassified Pseudomonas]MEB0042237.1 delta(1)-pyrroline-2-carboxylate reductase family protein [Pseudomonas sp. MH10]MEB0119610.1 delta(1)-pyrroline-2-carboxylate reductase family protein [Pseudomonas sp. CCI1.2]WPX65211.1 delta(1)-pyrroline-2-carboxylate reductase family protein [Pseudomonas sp. MH10]
MKVFNETETAALLPIRELIAALRVAAQQVVDGDIVSPERLVVALKDGGVMLSMPATSDDIAIHKLVNVNPRNRNEGLPTIHGQVVACDALSGVMLFQVDGPTVTGRRTAAVTLLGISCLLPQAPRSVLIIGGGTQAGNHVQAIAEVYPYAVIRVRGSSVQSAQAFVERFKASAPNLVVEDPAHPSDTEVVITVTTSKTPVHFEPARPDCLVIGVGAFTPDAAEICADVINASTVYVDDPLGATHEAGDLILANIEWARVKSLASALINKPDFSRPIVFKTVGTGAWDLAACRVIKANLEKR